MAKKGKTSGKKTKGFLRSIRSDFKKLFVTGLLVIIPVWLTFLIIKFLLGLMDNALVILPVRLRPETHLGFQIPGLGLILTIFIILIVGFFARNFLGRRIVRYMELLLERTPLVRKIYSAVKQFTYALLGDKKDQFQRAVMIEYPRKGIWSIAFVTNRMTSPVLAKHLPETSLCLFIPTTPNPTSGWFLILPESETIPLDTTIEDAFKVIISGGVVLPTETGASPAAESK